MRLLCQILKLSPSAYYDWLKQAGHIITEQELHLYRRCKALFVQSRGSLGSRMLMKNLRMEGFVVGRYKVRRLMKRLHLKVIQRRAYKVTTQQRPGRLVADNILDQQFDPQRMNQVWAGDVTYLRTAEGWMYLAIVMDLYSRRIIGWAMNKHMTVDLVNRALNMAIHLRQPRHDLLFHSDRGSQYTSQAFQGLLKQHKITPSMSGKGACWDNAVVERFFGSLKNEWLLNMFYLQRDDMAHDVETYIKYYNQDRLHTANNCCSPIEYESLNKVSGLCGPEQLSQHDVAMG